MRSLEGAGRVGDHDRLHFDLDHLEVVAHLPDSYNWRIAFLLGPALGFVVLFVRRHLPESSRGLLMHGRVQEAGVPSGSTAYYFMAFAAGNFLGPLLLGRYFDSIGRRKMITGTYAIAAVCLAISAILFKAGVLSALTQTIWWCVIFFFASAALPLALQGGAPRMAAVTGAPRPPAARSVWDLDYILAGRPPADPDRP